MVFNLKFHHIYTVPGTKRDEDDSLKELCCDHYAVHYAHVAFFPACPPTLSHPSLSHPSSPRLRCGEREAEGTHSATRSSLQLQRPLVVLPDGFCGRLTQPRAHKMECAVDACGDASSGDDSQRRLGDDEASIRPIEQRSPTHLGENCSV